MYCFIQEVSNERSCLVIYLDKIFVVVQRHRNFLLFEECRHFYMQCTIERIYSFVNGVSVLAVRELKEFMHHSHVSCFLEDAEYTALAMFKASRPFSSCC